MFKKTDLNPDYFYNNFHCAKNDASIIHLPQKDVLNKDEPYEVIYFINSICKRIWMG